MVAAFVVASFIKHLWIQLLVKITKALVKEILKNVVTTIHVLLEIKLVKIAQNYLSIYGN